MPTLQVIQHEQDPGQAQMLEASKNIADTIYKTQSLKLTGQYYKILAQNADTDVQKADLERKSQLFDKFLPKIQETSDPATKQMYIKALTDPKGLYKGDTQTFFHDVADGHKIVQDHYNSVTNTQPQSIQDQMAQMQPSSGVASQGQQAGSQSNLADQQSLQALSQSAANLAPNYNAVADKTRNFWDKMTGKSNDKMKVLEQQMQDTSDAVASRIRSLASPGSTPKMSFKNDSPAAMALETIHQSNPQHGNASPTFKPGTVKYKNGKLWRRAQDGGWDQIN